MDAVLANPRRRWELAATAAIEAYFGEDEVKSRPVPTPCDASPRIAQEEGPNGQPQPAPPVAEMQPFVATPGVRKFRVTGEDF